MLEMILFSNHLLMCNREEMDFRQKVIRFKKLNSIKLDLIRFDNVIRGDKNKPNQQLFTTPPDRMIIKTK